MGIFITTVIETMEQIEYIRNIGRTARIMALREKTISHPRYMSVDQARIITRVYRENETSPVSLKRARSLAA